MKCVCSEIFNEKMKNLTWWDVSLVKWSCLFFTIILVKLFPALLKINYPTLIILTILAAARPLYMFWFKK